MKLTPEQFAKLNEKQLANVIRKLNAGKTLTAREQAILRDSETAASPDPSFVTTLDDLAIQLGTTRRAMQTWRKDPRYAPEIKKRKARLLRADGRHCVPEWKQLMIDLGLKRADEAVASDAVPAAEGEVIQPPPFGGSAADWHKAGAAIDYERNKLKLETVRGSLLVASELEVPLGATFLAIGQRLSQFPERTAPQVAGFTDVHEVIAILRSEIERDLGELHGARHLDITVEQVIASLAVPEEIRAAVTTATVETLRRIGSAAMAVEQPVEQPAPKPQEIPTDAPPKVAKPVKKKRRSPRKKR